MIVRPKPHWLRMLFVWRGSVLPLILPQLLATTAFAILVTAIHGSVLSWKVSLNFVPFSLIGITLAIFLGFRNSTAYARYWEARTLLGMVLIAARSLTTQALTLSRKPQAATLLALRLSAFAHATKHQLRGTNAQQELQQFLSTSEVDRIQKASFPAAMSLRLVNDWVGEQVREGDIRPEAIPAMEHALAQLNTALGGCERIASTPIPFTYSVIIHRCIYLYCFWLPFGLLDAINYMTPVIVCFIAYTFFALEALGAQLEDPFGLESNDLPLAAIAYTVEAATLELVNEPARTQRPEAVDYVLL